MSKTLHQLTRFKEELKSKLALTKRVTMKAEEDMAKAEQAKKQQDYYVYQLNEQMRKLQEELAMYEYQLSIHRNDSRNMRDTLQDAAIEIR